MIMPYLSFNGECEEAFKWYEKIFDGKIEHLSRYGEVPNPESPMDDEEKCRVMHAQLKLTESGGISGADVLWPTESNGAISIHAHMPNETSARKVFNSLSKEGSVLGELATNPPPDDSGVSGCVRDKYGFTWIISALKD